jgi:hypothetical protein
VEADALGGTRETHADHGPGGVRHERRYQQPGYAEAAWINRIPASAWGLMIVIAFFSSMMQGYGARSESAKIILMLVLPFTVSLSLALISDIDSPRGGLIRVLPQNLLSLQASLKR